MVPVPDAMRKRRIGERRIPLGEQPGPALATTTARSQMGAMDTLPDPKPTLVPARLSTRRFALGTAVAAWMLYLAAAMVRCLTYGFTHPAMLMERHVLTALVAIGLSAGLHALLARHEAYDLSRRLTFALLLSAPPAALLSVVNYNVMFVFAPQYYLRDMGMDMHLTLFGEVLYSMADNYFVFAAWSVLSVAVGHEVRTRDALRRAAANEAAMRSAELRALRLQIDPHFLFNALNTVSGLVLAGDAAGAEHAIDALSSFLRATLAADASSDIPLAEELRLQMLYLRIEQVRFGDRLQVRTDVPDALLDCVVPALILQPITENAVRHAVARTSRPVRITITARRDRNSLVLAVENDGPGGAASGGHGLGLANVAARLALRYDRDARFTFQSRPGGGIRNELAMPISVPSRAAIPVP